jgi:hypothetical protein
MQREEGFSENANDTVPAGEYWCGIVCQDGAKAGAIEEVGVLAGDNTPRAIAGHPNVV